MIIVINKVYYVMVWFLLAGLFELYYSKHKFTSKNRQYVTLLMVVNYLGISAAALAVIAETL